jgi:hypothetical protein
MMKIFPGMTLERAKSMSWLDSNTLIACHNRDMRKQKQRREQEQRRQRRRAKRSRR